MMPIPFSSLNIRIHIWMSQEQKGNKAVSHYTLSTLLQRDGVEDLSGKEGMAWKGWKVDELPFPRWLTHVLTNLSIIITIIIIIFFQSHSLTPHTAFLLPAFFYIHSLPFPSVIYLCSPRFSFISFVRPFVLSVFTLPPHQYFLLAHPSSILCTLPSLPLSF